MAGAVCASGRGADPSTLHASPGAENVTVYWMSSVTEAGSACVSWGLHDGAYDLIADDGGNSCVMQDDPPQELRWASLRTLAYSSVPHVTLIAFIVSGVYTDGCDYIEARTWQEPGYESRGTYRYIHVQGATNYLLYIMAGRDWPRTDIVIGYTTDDSDCQGGWTGYHAHQDALGAPSTPNPSLPVKAAFPVWDSSYYIHKWTYPLPDTDGDDFDDVTEQYLGTDPLDACPDNPSDDAWPLDIDKNKLINLGGDAAPIISRIGARAWQPQLVAACGPQHRRPHQPRWRRGDGCSQDRPALHVGAAGWPRSAASRLCFSPGPCYNVCRL